MSQKKNRHPIEMDGKSFSYKGDHYRGAKLSVGSKGEKLGEAGYDALAAILNLPESEQGTAPADVEAPTK
jgi:hypothetical protein